MKDNSKKLVFSIVVVCLNAGEDLLLTINSVLGQDFDRYEIIIKDGISTDKSLDKIPIDKRIHIYNMHDYGIYDAMNQAIQLAKGRYICFMNCGDIFYSNDVLNHIYEEISSNIDDQDVIYGDYMRDGIINISPSKLKPSNPICHQTMFISKNVFDKYGLYDTNFKIMADRKHIAMTWKNGVNYKHVNCVVCIYKGGGYSETDYAVSRMKIENKQIVNTYFSISERFIYLIIRIIKKVKREISKRFTIRNVNNKS